MSFCKFRNSSEGSILLLRNIIPDSDPKSISVDFPIEWIEPETSNSFADGYRHTHKEKRPDCSQSLENQ